ncbi:MAG: hypothetical protein ABIQ31_20765 [Ferruginibacter sp.]
MQTLPTARKIWKIAICKETATPGQTHLQNYLNEWDIFIAWN